MIITGNNKTYSLSNSYSSIKLKKSFYSDIFQIYFLDPGHIHFFFRFHLLSRRPSSYSIIFSNFALLFGTSKFQFWFVFSNFTSLFRRLELQLLFSLKFQVWKLWASVHIFPFTRFTFLSDASSSDFVFFSRLSFKTVPVSTCGKHTERYTSCPDRFRIRLHITLDKSYSNSYNKFRLYT